MMWRSFCAEWKSLRNAIHLKAYAAEAVSDWISSLTIGRDRPGADITMRGARSVDEVPFHVSDWRIDPHWMGKCLSP